MNPCSVLVVEDHDLLRQVTVDFLQRSGFDAHGAFCAEEMDEHLSEHPIDLLLLDINLPGEDGLSIARRMRAAQPQLGILMLSARDQACDRVQGYSDGADIYLSKPVDHQELLAAIQSLLRRLHPNPDKAAHRTLRLDMRSLSLSSDTLAVRLTAAEAVVLRSLALAPDRNRAYWQLLEALDLTVDASGKAALEVRMTRLRKKLTALDVAAPGIRSLHKKGYQLSFEVELI